MERTCLYEMVTFSWNLDLRMVTPLGGGGNWANASRNQPTARSSR